MPKIAKNQKKNASELKVAFEILVLKNCRKKFFERERNMIFELHLIEDFGTRERN